MVVVVTGRAIFIGDVVKFPTVANLCLGLLLQPIRFLIIFDRFVRAIAVVVKVVDDVPVLTGDTFIGDVVR